MSKARISLALTLRAALDIQQIWDYSREQWGEATAGRYVDELQAGLQRLQEHSELAREHSDLHPSLRFYRVNKHLLVCDVQASSMVVLTVLHASMHIPSKLAELEPTLPTEVELLHQKLKHSRQRSRKRP